MLLCKELWSQRDGNVCGFMHAMFLILFLVFSGAVFALSSSNFGEKATSELVCFPTQNQDVRDPRARKL